MITIKSSRSSTSSTLPNSSLRMGVTLVILGLLLVLLQHDDVVLVSSFTIVSKQVRNRLFTTFHNQSSENNNNNNINNINSLSSLYSSINSNDNDNTKNTSTSTSTSTLQTKISNLKKILEREYTTFFNPMYKEYYNNNVIFIDPMTTLTNIQSYQNNVDMLSSRTLLGKVLFQDASITLHSITGGEIIVNNNDDSDVTVDGDNSVSINDIQTRWTLRLTMSILPWKPTARFTGISIYKVVEEKGKGKNGGVVIMKQIDYWDSVNIKPNSNGEYQIVEKGIAIQDFLNQLKPNGFQAQSAAPELPYQLLRRGDGYEVRKYPSYAGVRLPYKRRDEGFGSLGAFTKGMSPLSPALMDVQKDDTSDKFMMWPLAYTKPGELEPVVPVEALEKAGEGQWRTMKVMNVPSKVVAVREFSDASMEPVVRKADRELREFLSRDGLSPAKESIDLVQFAQYDAIFSMGRRRGEVWIDLGDGGHPW